MKRIVISDTHIGSKFYKEKELLAFLRSAEYDQLILAGDIIDFIRVPVFTERALKIAQAVDFSKEIIYLVGNHDTPLSGFVGQTAFGIKFMKSYEFEEDGKKFRIEHGDTYDEHPFLVANNFIMSFLSVAQNLIEHLFHVDLLTWITNIKLRKRKLIRIWDILNVNSDVDVFIMGHSHVPELVIWVLPDQTPKVYVNSGDWVFHTTYVRINNGKARLKVFKED